MSTIYLAVVLGGLGIAFVEQLLLPRFVARNTSWGLAPGWQREIAFWNIGLGAVIVGALRMGNPNCTSVVVGALVVLTSLLGLNHLLAALANREAWLHRVGALVNALAAIAGVMLLLYA